MTTLWPWITLALLGAYHGLNPGMGWLFAVALGLQEGSRAAVVRAFAPIALGHALSVALVVALVGTAQAFVSPTVLQIAGAGLLVLFGLYKLLRPLSHPRWVGLRVGARDLAAWSFLMATAHGAGLMLVPVLLQLPAASASPASAAAPAAYTMICSHNTPVDHNLHAGHAMPSDPAVNVEHSAHAGHLPAAGAMGGLPLAQAAAVGVHTISMFLVMGLLAVVVYEKLGLAILRRAWFNLDRLWAGALILSGALVLLL
jgi:hypothetical protein